MLQQTGDGRNGWGKYCWRVIPWCRSYYFSPHISAYYLGVLWGPIYFHVGQHLSLYVVWSFTFVCPCVCSALIGSWLTKKGMQGFQVEARSQDQNVSVICVLQSLLGSGCFPAHFNVLAAALRKMRAKVIHKSIEHENSSKKMVAMLEVSGNVWKVERVPQSGPRSPEAMKTMKTDDEKRRSIRHIHERLELRAKRSAFVVGYPSGCGTWRCGINPCQMAIFWMVFHVKYKHVKSCNITIISINIHHYIPLYTIIYHDVPLSNWSTIFNLPSLAIKYWLAQIWWKPSFFRGFNLFMIPPLVLLTGAMAPYRWMVPSSFSSGVFPWENPNRNRW